MAETVTTIPDAEVVLPTRVRLRTTLAAMAFIFCLAVPMTPVFRAGGQARDFLLFLAIGALFGALFAIPPFLLGRGIENVLVTHTDCAGTLSRGLSAVLIGGALTIGIWVGWNLQLW